MTQQYPQQPPQPGWNGQQQPGQPPAGWAGPGAPQQMWGPPQPPKKSSAGKIIGFGCLGVVALFVVLGVIGAALSGGSDSTDHSSKDKAVSAAGSEPKADQSEKAPAKERKPAGGSTSQAEQFQACVAKSGTPTEKAAVKHVTKVTGTDKRNDILDAAEVWTDYTGGLMSSNAGDAKLIASAFTSCYESKNGLVSIYGKDGDLIANANY
ncbi:hypothetical protein AB0N92_18050 [Streptomyces sp. NPDC093248]|uniref:hypothetical protein n=1 Tax=Streptomyces sp. NPDC093248 TaxID=3155072 RepID=UPI00344AF2C0